MGLGGTPTVGRISILYVQILVSVQTEAVLKNWNDIPSGYQAYGSSEEYGSIMPWQKL